MSTHTHTHDDREKKIVEKWKKVELDVGLFLQKLRGC